MKNIVVLGKHGLMGSAFPDTCIKLGHQDANVLFLSELEKKLSTLSPDMIINCSGLVDRADCEKNPLSAYQINTAGVVNVAAVAKKLNAKLIQFATVCDNHDDIYSKSKKMAKKIILDSSDNYSIVNLPTMFGGKNNYGKFLLSVMYKIKNNQPIDVFAGETFSPTYTQDVVEYLLDNIEALPKIITLMNVGSPGRIEFIRTVASMIEANDEDIIFNYLPHRQRLENIEKLITLRFWKQALLEAIK